MEDTQDYSGLWFIDSVDIYTEFGITIDDGLSGFLEYPDLKIPPNKKWGDQNGTEYDLSTVFFEEKDITIKYTLTANSHVDFWIKHKGFFDLLKTPDKKRFYYSKYGRSFYVFFLKNTALTKLNRFEDGFIACSYTVVLREPEPSLFNPFSFLTDKDGNYLVTLTGGKLIVT